MFQTASTGNLLCAAIFSAVLWAAAADVGGAQTAGQNPERDLARQILKLANSSGGLIVHLGCGDGRLTAALHVSDSCLIHGLDADANRVRQAREYIRQLGIYGPVSVERWDGKRLPYADGLVNLVVAEDLGGAAVEEAMRVLAPGGTLCAKQQGRWTKTVKPRPETMDEWTHYLHDASGNPVAHDQVVGPPRYVQWIAGPRHTRSHEHIPSIYALVSAAGRIFYIADEGPIASIRQSPNWQLVARDAYSGVLLWKQPVTTWFPHIVNWGQTPSQLERRLVAVGDRVYVTLGLHAPLSVLDGATGELVKVYASTGGTEEIIWHKGILLLAVRSVTEERTAELAKWAQLVRMKDSPLYERDSAQPLVTRLRATEAKSEVAVLALDAETGRSLWKRDGANTSGLKALSLCANGDRTFYQNGKDVVCVDLKSGRELWSESSAPLRVVCDSCVVCADGKAVKALSPESGKTLWTQAAPLTDVKDVFLASGSLWLGGFKPCPEKRAPAWGPYFATRHDLATGEMLAHIDPENPGHHHRCYLNKATDRYILGGRRGVEFIDLQSGDVLWNSWVRGVCKYGIMPCNGLLYAPPHACGCYIAVKLTGFYALAPEKDQGRGTKDPGPGTKGESVQPPLLERGPAYASGPNPQSPIPNPQSPAPNPSDWPTYRHDAQRSGCTGTAVPAALRCRWQAEVGGRLTSPTACDGKVFVASVDEHRLSAIDADSGRFAWHFTADARVDSPPTLYQNRAIFGCRDGLVYSLRISDGALAWRLRAARQQRRIVADGQLESASPVCGSVLIQHGAAYFTAGRSSYLDGGIDLHRIEPASGKTLSTTAIYSPDPQTGRQPPQAAPYLMPGALADILTGDGSHVYLRDLVFDNGGVSRPEGNPHLFTLTGFLDDSWPHRSYWIFGTQCSLATGCSRREKDLIFGRLLGFDGSAIYGYGRATVHWSNQLQDGPYRLFAVKHGAGTAHWEKSLPVQVRAMVLASKVLLVAGPPAEESTWQTSAEASQKGLLLVISTSDGTVLAQHQLDSPPIFDGMAAAGDRLYIALENGRLVCMDETANQ